jgi:PadR family transcriptional regulator, regulatory protein PadR
LSAEPKAQTRPRKWLIPITLVLLEEERSHGYELMQRMEEEFGFEQINPGPVYRTLRRMENEGLCRSEWDVPRARRVARPGGCTPSPRPGRRIWRPGPKRARTTRS